MTRAILFPVITAILTAMVACGCTTNSCADCGECGIVGGINGAETLNFGTWGEDDAGAPVVGLVTWKKGECASANGDFYWLMWDGDDVTVEPRASFSGIDTSNISQDGRGYLWNGHDLVVDETRVSAMIIELTFSENGATTLVRCEASSTALACSKVAPK